MLEELSVRNLGVIAELSLVLGSGMTAITGETGAGKTMVVDAIELLVGGRASAGAVRHGCDEATVEGRFGNQPGGDQAGGIQPGGDRSAAEQRTGSEAAGAGDEVVVRRVLPARGRTRAYIGGRMATAAELADLGASLVDLHGQHDHQSLLAAAAQRAALDAYGEVPVVDLTRARAAVAEIDDQLAALGGDARTRAREVDLLRFQVSELEAAGLSDPEEDTVLAAEQEALSGASAHRQAAAAAHELLAGDDAAGDLLGRAVSALDGSGPLERFDERLRNVAAELADVSAGLRDAAENLEDDPARLAEVVARRQLLVELRRKYGATLAEVMAYGDEIRGRLADLEHHEQRVADLEAERARRRARYDKVAAGVAAARRKAAPGLARDVEGRLATLAMPRARLEVQVNGDGPADHVTFLLAANPGEPPAPLAKAASGGELARTMLALRLVLGGHPPDGHQAGGGSIPTLIFDEVDAGIGGEVALAVGRALADLGRDHQVLVVTHLAQVAAYADHHVEIRKDVVDGRTVASARLVSGEERVVELSRMLSGQPDSAAARRHAEELLVSAGRPEAQRLT